MKIFVGYDQSENEAYHTCVYSIKKYQSKENEIIRLDRHELIEKQLYTRTRVTENGSTNFAFTRFLVPYLAGYKEEPVLFVDCDFVFLEDVNKLEDTWDKTKAVSVCKFPKYNVLSKVKMNGAKQSWYPKKNWSSFMLFNPAHMDNMNLNVETVSASSGKYLHRFMWTSLDAVGELDFGWNTLNGYHKLHRYLKDAFGWSGKTMALHYTDGGPWFSNYKYCPMSFIYKEMKKEYEENIGSDNDL